MDESSAKPEIPQAIAGLGAAMFDIGSPTSLTPTTSPSNARPVTFEHRRSMNGERPSGSRTALDADPPTVSRFLAVLLGIIVFAVLAGAIAVLSSAF